MSLELKLELTNSEDASLFIKGALLAKGIETQTHHLHHTAKANHVALIEKISGKVHHVKFAKEPFYSFGYYFKQFPHEHGDSLDEEVVESLKDDDVIYFAYPDIIYKIEKSYFIQPQLWRDTKRGTKTCSFPINNMEVFAR